MPGIIAKVHFPKAHVSPQRHQGSVFSAPCPLLLCPIGFDVNPLFVLFRLLGHGLEYPLRACQGGQQKISLLGELIDRRGGLPDKHQIAGQASYIRHAL